MNALGAEVSGYDGRTTERAGRGPLFIVGLPRSGTKLIRDLLNGSPEIGIPVEESHFIPYYIARFGSVPEPGDEAWRKKFMSDLRRTPFLRNYARAGRGVPDDLLTHPPQPEEWPAVFQRVLTHFAPEGRSPGYLWGDKTPGYLRHLDLLRALYPSGRVLHIIRDPRERCLSVRYAWGRSLLRAATSWRREMERGRRAALEWGERYAEVRYEQLTSDPEEALRGVCRALDLPYSPAMLQLARPSENVGRARGHVGILSNNTQKYLTELSPRAIRRIEEIVYPVALELGYPLHYASEEKPLGRLPLAALRFHDGFAAWRYHVRDKGFGQGTRYFYELHRVNSWHQGNPGDLR